MGTVRLFSDGSLKFPPDPGCFGSARRFRQPARADVARAGIPVGATVETAIATFDAVAQSSSRSKW